MLFYFTASHCGLQTITHSILQFSTAKKVSYLQENHCNKCHACPPMSALSCHNTLEIRLKLLIGWLLSQPPCQSRVGIANLYIVKYFLVDIILVDILFLVVFIVKYYIPFDETLPGRIFFQCGFIQEFSSFKILGISSSFLTNMRVSDFN